MPTVRFTQETRIHRIGFANSCELIVGDPEPVLADLEVLRDVNGRRVCDEFARTRLDNGSMATTNTPLTLKRLVRHDHNPYIAARGWGVPDDGSSVFRHDELPVRRCEAYAAKHYDGVTEDVFYKDYTSSPAFWGIGDPPSVIPLSIEYDMSAWCAWLVDRVVFAYIEALDANGELRRYEHVAALPGDDHFDCDFRMWGMTESWGSEGKKMLFIPSRDSREPGR